MAPAEITSRAAMRSCGGEHIAEDGCGILERVCRAAKNSNTIGEFLDASYNSKYTDARINRVILFSILGVSDKLTHSLPEYTVLLGASECGRKFLSTVRKASRINIITKPADAPESSVQRIIGESADIFYTSAFPQKKAQDHFIKSHPFIQK